MAGSGLEGVSESERAEGRITSCASSSNRKPVTVDFSGSDKISGAIDAVIDIDNSPVTFKSLPIFAAVARASAVVDIENRDTSAGPILDCIAQRGRSSRGWATMAHHQERRLFICRFEVISISGGIENSMRGQAIFRWKLDGAR